MNAPYRAQGFEPAGGWGPSTCVVVGGFWPKAGKSTLALNVAVGLMSRGYTVSCMNIGSGGRSLASRLANRGLLNGRLGNAKFRVPFIKQLPSDGREGSDGRYDARRAFLAALAVVNGSDFVVVDTPSAPGPISRFAHLFADIIVTPVSDDRSSRDILLPIESGARTHHTAGPYLRLVNDVNERRLYAGVQPVRWVIVPNRLQGKGDARSGRALRRALTGLERLSDFAVTTGVSESDWLRRCASTGLTVFDLPRVDPEGASGDEAALLSSGRQELGEVLSLLERYATRATIAWRALNVEASPFPSRSTRNDG